jgi:hypothetical protein
MPQLDKPTHFHVELHGDTNCAQGSQGNELAASAEVTNLPECNGHKEDMNNVAATKVGHAFHECRQGSHDVEVGQGSHDIPAYVMHYLYRCEIISTTR